MSEVRTISKKTAFMFFHFFSIPVPVQVRIYEPVHVKETRGTKSNCPASG